VKLASPLLGCSILILSVEALAEEPAVQPAAAESPVLAALQKQLVEPLHKRDVERSKYSRVPVGATERRVRLLDASAVKDTRGEEMIRFAIDSRRGRFYEDDDEQKNPWHEGSVVGCIYPKDNAIFVKHGDDYRAGKTLLGKKAPKPPLGVCAPADTVARR
jgi:hypothetical protein